MENKTTSQFNERIFSFHTGQRLLLFYKVLVFLLLLVIGTVILSLSVYAINLF